MKKSPDNQPPAHLSKSAKTWWRRLTAGYEFEDADYLLLVAALESYDRMQQARRILSKDGVVSIDRFGQKRAHPATLIERDSRSAMIRSFAALHLDIEPLRDGSGRPPGGQV